MQGTEPHGIYGECGEFAVTGRLWRNMLTLAQRYGWRPAGTKPPEAWIWSGHPSDRDGRYFPADCQQIMERDAKAFAAALANALPDIPEHDALATRVLDDRGADTHEFSAWGRRIAGEESVTPFEEFSGPNKSSLRLFIIHARRCSRNGGLWIC